MTPGAPNILIVRFSSIGDLLLTTPLLRALRTRHPEARITCVLREDMADTLRHNPRIDRLITWRHGTPLSALGRQLREEPWTHRLDLHGSLRSHALRRLVGGRWTGYPKHRLRRALLIRTHRARGGDLGPVAERYFAAARDLDVFPDGGPAEFFTTPEADREAAAFLTTHRLGELRPIVAVAPGAAHFTKRWPAAHWEALAARLPATHDLLVLGGPAERELGERIVAAAGRGASAAGQFSLIGSGALLKRAAALVAGDTGVLHLATAVGTPAVALYGPTVREFGFFPYHAQAVVVERDLRCRPCTAHGGPACPLGHLHCLVQIEPTAVLTALEALGR